MGAREAGRSLSAVDRSPEQLGPELVRVYQNRTDVRTIQLLLGHRSLATISRHLKIATSTLCATSSPLDLLPKIEHPTLGSRLGVTAFLCRENGRTDPEFLQPLDRSKEFGEVDGFRHVAIGVQIVCLPNIAIVERRAEDHDRNATKRFIVLHLGEHLETAHARQVQIKKDKTGQRIGRVGARTAQIQQRLSAVSHRFDLARHPCFHKGLPDKIGVSGVVLDE